MTWQKGRIMTNQAQFSLLPVDLANIQPDPLFTPEALQLRGAIAPRTEIVEEYLRLFQRVSYVAECFKVWHDGDVYYLLDNYEAYEAARLFFTANPTMPKSLNCIVVRGPDKVLAKELGNRLREIRGGTLGYHERCFNLLLLRECGCSLSKVQAMYGVTKAKSTKGKMLERDYKLISHPLIYRRVLGLTEEKVKSALMVAVAKPSPLKATLTYAQALDVIRILRSDQICIETFDRDYQRYLDDLDTKHRYPGEENKPVFKRQNYDRHRVKAIAVAASRNGTVININMKAALGDAELEDQAWRPALNQRTFDLPVPAIRVNLASKSDSNIKKIVDLKFKMEALARSLDSYIKRIEPVDHGDPVRVKDDTIEPYLETRGNMAKWEDYSYFNYIRHRKLLHYCNRETLLRSIGLKAHNFGFKSYRYDDATSWIRAATEFNSWWSHTFVQQVHLNYGGDEGRHPLHRIFVEFKLVLDSKANDATTVYLCDFIKEVFSKVFRELDQQRWLMAEKYSQMERDRELARAVFSRSLPDKLREAGVTSEEAAKLLQAQPHHKQQIDSLVSMVAQMQMQFDQIMSAMRDSA